MSLGARAEELLARKIGIPPQVQPLDVSLYPSLNDTYEKMTTELQSLGARALGTEWNTNDFSYAGVSEGITYPANFAGIFRKAGLMNAILTKEYYDLHSTSQPARHTSHRPIAS